MRRAALLAVALALAAGAAGARPPCAHACSCGPFDAERSLGFADAAVVGEVVERRVEGGKAVVVLDVERRLRGPVRDRIEVETAVDSAACGLSARPGERVALFLEEAGARWSSNLCHQAPPEAVAALPSLEGGEDVADSFAEATAWVIAVVAVAAVGVFLLRRRYRPD